MRKRVGIVAAVVLALGAVTGGIAIAGGAGDDDKPLTGSSLDRASDAALKHTGGGKVIETEVGDDGAAYGVEVRLDDGSVVEVNLNSDYSVIGQEADDDGANDKDDEQGDD